MYGYLVPLVSEAPALSTIASCALPLTLGPYCRPKGPCALLKPSRCCLPHNTSIAQAQSVLPGAAYLPHNTSIAQSQSLVPTTQNQVAQDQSELLPHNTSRIPTKHQCICTQVKGRPGQGMPVCCCVPHRICNLHARPLPGACSIEVP